MRSKLASILTSVCAAVAILIMILGAATGSFSVVDTLTLGFIVVIIQLDLILNRP